MTHNAPKRRVGLLGGSFNPAHEGHLHISQEALKRLDLDQVWWLVSPQNPLKPTDGMMPYENRLQDARLVTAQDRRIIVSDVERDLGTRFTAETLSALKQRHQDIRFVWMMGTDNMIQVPHWQAWTEIFNTVPIAVFTRPSYDLRALLGKAAVRFSKARVASSGARRLPLADAPAWAYIGFRRHPASATMIRDRAGTPRTISEPTAPVGTTPPVEPV